MALNSGNNSKAHVLEISNRANIQTLTTDAVVTLTDRIANHESSLNTNAHQISNIFGLQTELNSKEPAILTKNTAFNKNYGSTSDTVCQGNDSRLSDARTPLAHTHTISNITGLQTTLEGKASTTHSHVISDIVNLQTVLDSKASTSHSHTISNITNLQNELDNKANVFTGYTGSIGVVIDVDFIGQTTTKKTINITNGIVVSII